MPCPTCDHTMHQVGTDVFWCPRCGTIRQRLTKDHTEADVPRVVALVKGVVSGEVNTKASIQRLHADLRECVSNEL